MDKKTVGYLRKVVERTKDFDALVSLDTLVGLAFDLQKENEQLKADRLEMAEAFLGFLEVDNPILKKTVCRECGNWTWSDKIKHKHNCIGKKAEQIIKDGE